MSAALPVTLIVDGAVAHLTLERPEALNALNRAMAAALERALEDLAASPAVAVVVRGRGRAFCAGNDLKEMPSLGREEAERLSHRWEAIVDGFARLPQVTIAAVHGYALGGGCMLAVAQDLRIAAVSARFGLPEVTLGFNPSYGIARFLDVAGGGPGRDLLLTGRAVDAGEALRLGLVSRVVPDEALDAEAGKLAADIARCPRAGLAAAKRVVAEIRAGRAGDAGGSYGAALWEGEGAQAKLAAFAARERAGTSAAPVRPHGGAPGTGDTP